MTIVLNEHEWAKDMIDAHSLGKKPFETLCRVSRYYLDHNYSKRDARKMLDIFLLQCDPTISIPKWAGAADHAIDRAVKTKAVCVDSVVVTKPEMDIIDSLRGKQLQRLAFTLLCLSKYWDLVNPNGDHWVNNRDTDIMKMANINTSIKRQSALYFKLNEAGLIQFSKKVDNTNVRVCFAKDGSPAIHISDFRNLGYQYLRYHGEPFFECKNCGVTVKETNEERGRRHLYCKECASEVAVKQRVNSVMRDGSYNDSEYIY